MSYKSILTCSEKEEGRPGHQVAASIELARRFDAHLTIAGSAHYPELTAYGFDGGAGIGLAELYSEAREQAEARARWAGVLIEREGIRGDALSLASSYSGTGDAFGRLARFSDLVVASQPSVERPDSAAAILIEGALFGSDAAVLVVPASTPRPPGSTVLIGWSGDREALRAVRRAMPFLHQATRLEIAAVDPSGPEENPGEELAVFLSRHGLTVEITSHPRAGKSIGEVLRRRAADIDADLLVMGAYGHSRFRESVIGGVTRDMLEHAQIPLLLAH